MEQQIWLGSDRRGAVWSVKNSPGRGIMTAGVVGTEFSEKSWAWRGAEREGNLGWEAGGENAKNFTQYKLSACLLEITESYFEKQNMPFHQ